MATKIGHRWFGYLTVENLEEVAEAIGRLLEGKWYTFTSGSDDSDRITVRTSRRLAPEKTTDGKAISTYCEKKEDYTSAGFNVADSYGSWGLYIPLNPEKRPYLSFSRDQLEMNHYAPSGTRITWVVAVEDHEE